MGHDAIAIGNHTLNTKSIYDLAVDLSKRTGVTIRYGYTNDWVDEQTGAMGNFEFVEQGRIVCEGPWLYTLNDSYYMDMLHDPETFKNNVLYDFYDSKANGHSVTIYADCFYTGNSFYSRWWRFVEYFQGAFVDDPKYKNYIDQWRWSVQNQVTMFGGNLAIYGDDQGDSQFIDDDMLPFEAIRQKVLSTFGPACLQVSAFQQLYPDGKFEDIEYKAFIDDFADL